jgi:HAD superfamily hydrolase (TIGR01509 family)
MPWPQAAIFDFDGLLADTSACWLQAYSDALAGQGHRLDAAAISQLAGASVETAAVYLGVPATRLGLCLYRAFSDIAPQLLPGARQIVTLLAQRMPVGVATNAPAPLVEAVLDAAGLRRHLDAIVGAEPPRSPKPAPDVYVATCHALGVAPSRTVALEDSLVGVMSARRAGLTVIGVACGPEIDGTHLHVPRLDDHRLHQLLGLDDNKAGNKPGN